MRSERAERDGDALDRHDGGGSRSEPAGSAPSRKLSLKRKLAFSLVTTVTLLALIELALAAAGVQPMYLTRDPYVGFVPGVRLFVREGDQYRTNPSKLGYFNAQQFPVEKEAGAFRVFTLGGSTTFGHPYKDPTSFTGWLRALLNDVDHSRKWEVINCGGVSYASYRECLLMNELVEYQPDLFIVCTGHNEFLEKRTYPGRHERSAWRATLEGAAAHSRFATLAHRLLPDRLRPSRPAELAGEVDTILEHSIGPAEYHRDTAWQEAVVAHFDCSLDRMAALASSVGARLLFVTPASNMRDFSPFKSEHGETGFSAIVQADEALRAARAARDAGRVDEAARAFEAAAALDLQFAQVQWETGTALLAAGRLEDARSHFQRAIDEDICPLRAIGRIEQAVVEAAQRNGATLVDFRRLLSDALADAAAPGIPGNESFLDHVHPTIDVHRRLAWVLFDQMAEQNLVAPPADRQAANERVAQKVLARIDARAHAMALVQVMQVLGWAGKNAEALALADHSETAYPGVSEVAAYRGRMLEKLGRTAEALAAYHQAVQRDPENSLARGWLGLAQLSLGEPSSAQENLERAIRQTPDSAPVSFRTKLHLGLGQALYLQRRFKEAAVEFEAALQLSPGSQAALEFLQQARSP